MIVNEDSLLEIQTNDVPFDIVPCLSLLCYDMRHKIVVDWTDCVTPGQIDDEKDFIAEINRTVKNIHEDKSMTMGQVLLAYVDRIFPIIHNLTLANAREYSNVLKTRLINGATMMSGYLDPQISSNILKNDILGVKTGVELFNYVNCRLSKHDFFANRYLEYKSKNEYFSKISYSMDSRAFWERIAQNEGHEEFAEWASALTVLPAYGPKIDEEEWFKKFENFAGTDEQLSLRKYLYFKEL